MQIFLAGADAWADLLMDMGVRNQLMSFYYFRTALRSSGHKALSILARMKRAHDKGYRFMLDSGAFTYQLKAKKQPMPPPRAYYDEYLEFIYKYHHLFDIIAEFDIDGTVMVDRAGNTVTFDPQHPDEALKNGGNWVETHDVDVWTNILLNEKSVRSKILPVYHPTRKIGWLEDWLLDTRSPLVGFGSDSENAAPIIALCHRWGKWVHGFGQTRIKTDIKYTHFDSVDSSTWLRSDKYGGTMIFQSDQLIVIDNLHKDRRRSYKNYYERWGLDFNKIIKDDLQENRLATIVCWRELSNSFERKAVIRNKGRYPFLWEMHRDGKVPLEHPLLTKIKAEKVNG